MVYPQWLNLLGLSLALAGAVLLTWGLIISRKQALKIGVSRFAEENDEKNDCLPQVRNELRESRFALIGVILFAAGFLLQIIAALLSLSRPQGAAKRLPGSAKLQFCTIKKARAAGKALNDCLISSGAGSDS